MSRQPRHRRPQQGFSLLEAIVAMTIMATCLMALYAWLSSSTLAMNRVRANAEALADARAAKALIETINPMAEGSGSRLLPPLEIRWEAQPIADLRLGMSPAGSATPFDFRLYEMEVGVLRDGRVVREFRMRKAGWTLARPINPNDF